MATPANRQLDMDSAAGPMQRHPTLASSSPMDATAMPFTPGQPYYHVGAPTPSPSNINTTGHGYGCMCPTCACYGAPAMYHPQSDSSAAPYALMQQYMAQLYAAATFAHVQTVTQAATMVTHCRSGHSPATGRSPTLSGLSPTTASAWPGASAFAAVPASPWEGSSAPHGMMMYPAADPATTTPLRRLDFNAAISATPYVPSLVGEASPDASIFRSHGDTTMMNDMSPNAAATANNNNAPFQTYQEIQERMVLEAEDVIEFCRSNKGRDAAIAVVSAVASSEAATRIKVAFLPQFARLSTDPTCVHVMRALMEGNVTDSELRAVVRDLVAGDYRDVLNLATTSPHTRKLLEFIIEQRHRAPSIRELEEILVKNTKYLAVSQQGCIALMHLIKTCPESHAQTFAQLRPCICALAVDPFANYVIQAVIEHGEESAVVEVLRPLRSKLSTLACNKFGSNVLERAVKAGAATAASNAACNSAVRRLVVSELLFHNDATAQAVCHDQFGNFVVQAIVATAQSSAEYRRICERVRKAIVGSPYAARIDARMKARRGACIGPTTRDESRSPTNSTTEFATPKAMPRSEQPTPVGQPATA
jgi:hypothetical protein